MPAIMKSLPLPPPTSRPPFPLAHTTPSPSQCCQDILNILHIQTTLSAAGWCRLTLTSSWLASARTGEQNALPPISEGSQSTCTNLKLGGNEDNAYNVALTWALLRRRKRAARVACPEAGDAGTTETQREGPATVTALADVGPAELRMEPVVGTGMVDNSCAFWSLRLDHKWSALHQDGIFCWNVGVGKEIMCKCFVGSHCIADSAK